MNGAPRWFQDALNSLFTESTPDVVPTYEHTWPLPVATALLLLLIGAAIVAFCYARERAVSRRLRIALASMRCGVLAVLVIMLFGWMLHRHRVDLPDLIVAIDVSGSMAVEDVFRDSALQQHLKRLIDSAELSESRRIDAAKAILLGGPSLWEQLETRYHLKLFTVANTAQQQTGGDLTEAIRNARAEGSQSRLGEGLRTCLELQRGRPTAGLILITDGITTEGPALSEAAAFARRMSIPVFAIATGNREPPRDVRLSDLLVDEVVFAGDSMHFDFKIAATGYDKQSATVQLKRKDDEATVLDERTVDFSKEDDIRSVRLTHVEEEEGEYDYVVEVKPLPDETNPTNNRMERRVRVRAVTIRVLLVQEYPNYDFRFLKSMLRRGTHLTASGEVKRSFELTTVLQEADLEYAEQDESAQRVFPVNREELFGYDVLVFGDVNPAHLSTSTMQHISDFVAERGGGVVFLAGPRHTPQAYDDTPIEMLFPFSLATISAPSADAVLDDQVEFRPAPTRLGLTSPQMQLASTVPASLAMWRRMPPLFWLLEAPDLKPATRVLAAHPTRSGINGANLPVICMQFVGAGKVICHLTDETYRWAKHEDGDQYYERYWVQTIRFLSRSKLLGGSRQAELTADRREYRQGDAVRLRVRFFDDRAAPSADDGVAVVVERDGGQRREPRLNRDTANRGVFEGSLARLGEGDYRVWLASPTLPGQPPATQFKISAPLGEQARLQMDVAELQRTAKLTNGQYYHWSDYQKIADDLPEGRKVRIESMPPEPIWNNWILATLFVVLIVGEWLLRKRVGML